MFVAICSGKPDVVEPFVEKVGPNYTFMGGCTALYWAVAEDQLEVARFLLSKGADTKKATPLLGITPLRLAQVEKNYKMVALLEEFGAKV